MKNGNLVINTLQQYPLEGVQLAWDKSHENVNYLLYEGEVYSIGQCDADTIRNGIEALSMHLICPFNTPKRVTPALRTFLEVANPELLSRIQQRTTMRTRQHWRKLTDEEKKFDNIEAVVDLINDGLEMRSPNKIVSDFLTETHEKNKGLKMIALAEVIGWYYHHYDLYTIKEFYSYEGGHPENFYKINDVMTSKEVLRLVMQGYSDYYNLNKTVTEKGTDKMAECLTRAGFGVIA